MEEIICKYFVRFYAPRFHWDKDPKWDNERLVPFQTAIAKTDKKSLVTMPFLHKVLISKVRKNNLKAMKRWTNIILIKKKLGKMLTNKRQFLRAVNLPYFL